MNLVDLLGKQRLFEGVDIEVLQEIARHIKVQKFDKHDYVVVENSKGDSLMMLFAGRLKVIIETEDGREIGLQLVQPGESAGELSVIDGQPRTASLVAEAPSIVGFLPRAIARSLFLSNSVVTDRIMGRLCAQVRQGLQQKVSGMTRAYPRVYAVLLKRARVIDGKTSVIENLPNQEAIAMMANVRRETVSRAIHALIERGVVVKDTRRLIVHDPNSLDRLARGELDVQHIVHPKADAASAAAISAPAGK